MTVMRQLRLAIIVFLFTFLTAAVGAQNDSRLTGGNGTLYIGGFGRTIHVIDEATEQVVDDIQVSTGIPAALTLSANRERFYVNDTMMEHIENHRYCDTFDTRHVHVERGKYEGSHPAASR